MPENSRQPAQHDVWNALAIAVHRAYEMNRSLWTLKVQERARVGQIFLNLRSLVPPHWDVDTEYDREDVDGLQKQRAATGVHGIPHVVVHHRGRTGALHNLLVVEFKNTHENLRHDSEDYAKVTEWRDRFGYQYGAVVGLGPSVNQFDPHVLWFSTSSPQPTTRQPLVARP